MTRATVKTYHGQMPGKMTRRILGGARHARPCAGRPRLSFTRKPRRRWPGRARPGRYENICIGGETSSHRLDKPVDHLLLAGLVEGDGELVAIDLDDMAVAKFLVEDALLERKLGRRAGGFGD